MADEDGNKKESSAALCFIKYCVFAYKIKSQLQLLNTFGVKSTINVVEYKSKSLKGTTEVKYKYLKFIL